MSSFFYAKSSSGRKLAWMRRIAAEHMKPGWRWPKGYNGSGVTQISAGSVLKEAGIAKLRSLASPYS